MTTLLSAQSVSKSFGGVQALRDCSLSVQKGSITGLIGPNGSGKTTLFNVITGYVKPDVGTVNFDGEPMTHGLQVVMSRHHWFSIFRLANFCLVPVQTDVAG